MRPVEQIENLYFETSSELLPGSANNSIKKKDATSSVVTTFCCMLGKED